MTLPLCITSIMVVKQGFVWTHDQAIGYGYVLRMKTIWLTPKWT